MGLSIPLLLAPILLTRPALAAIAGVINDCPFDVHYFLTDGKGTGIENGLLQANSGSHSWVFSAEEAIKVTTGEQSNDPGFELQSTVLSDGDSVQVLLIGEVYPGNPNPFANDNVVVLDNANQQPLISCPPGACAGQGSYPDPNGAITSDQTDVDMILCYSG